MDKFQSHFSGCSEFVNFIFPYGGNKFCSQFIYHKYTFLYAVIVVTYTIFFTYCKCDLHFWRLRYQNMSCFQYYPEMKETNLGRHLLVTHI